MIIDQITVRETVAFDDAAGLRRTKDGYLVASPRVARTGIQIYGGAELGRPDLERVRVLRPESEVFDKAAMASIGYRPISNDHPDEPITADNWRKHAVGHVASEVARDGEYIRVPLAVFDGQTIKDIDAGKRELSLGYSANLEWRAGETEGGDQYDAVQTNIRVNHLAIVDTARGGRKLTLGDHSTRSDPQDEATGTTGKQGVRKMPNENLKTVLVDGISVDMSDTAAQVVNRMIAKHETDAKATSDKIATLTTDSAKAAEAAGVAATAAKTLADTQVAEIATLKKQLEDAKMTPAKLDALVKDRAEVIAKATSVLGDKLIVLDKTESDMRKQVVVSKLGDACKDWTDEQIRASFVSFTADVKPGTSDAATVTARTFSGQPNATANQIVDKAHDDYDKRISNAWRGENAAAAAKQ